MVTNLLSKGLPPLVEKPELNKKNREKAFPRLSKYLRPWGIAHLPTAFGDVICALLISRRQWVNFFGPAVPIKVIATAKIRNI